MLTGSRYLSRVFAPAAMVVLLCACGATTSSSNVTPPTIVLGDKGSTEQLLLGELYAQALRAQGYIVVLEPNLGDTEQLDAAFQSGRIDAYPEDLGDLAATDAGHSALVASEAEAEQIGQQYELAHGAMVLLPVTPFSASGAAVTLASWATQRNLTTIGQLSALPFRVKYGDDTADQSEFGGLQQAYGLSNVEFVPLAAGTSVYDALNNHVVQVGEGLATDPQLTVGAYAVLSDPKNIFGFHHVALIIRTSLLSRLGSRFQQTYSSVTNLLTLSAMQSLNKAVAVDGQMPASAAHSFLLANGLVGS